MKFYLSVYMLACITISANAADLTTIVTNTPKGTTVGAIDLSVSGGKAPYQISWIGPNGFKATTEDLANLAAGDYTVTVTDSYCGTATTVITIVGFTTGIDEIDAEQILVFPNPTSAGIEIKLPELFKNFHFRMLSALGELVTENSNVAASSFTVDMKDVSAGVYFLEIIQDNHLYRKKVIKY